MMMGSEPAVTKRRMSQPAAVPSRIYHYLYYNLLVTSAFYVEIDSDGNEDGGHVLMLLFNYHTSYIREQRGFPPKGILKPPEPAGVDEKTLRSIRKSSNPYQLP